MEKKPMSKIVVAIIIVAIIILLFIIGRFALHLYYTHDSNKSVASSVKFDERTKEVRLLDVKFNIPINLIITREEKYFKLQDSSGDYEIRVDISNNNFDELVQNYRSLKLGFDAVYNSKPQLIEYGGKQYIVANTAKDITKTLVAYTKATDEEILIIRITNKRNTYDYGLLEKYSEIINAIS